MCNHNKYFRCLLFNNPQLCLHSRSRTECNVISPQDAALWMFGNSHGALVKNDSMYKADPVSEDLDHIVKFPKITGHYQL